MQPRSLGRTSDGPHSPLELRPLAPDMSEKDDVTLEPEMVVAKSEERGLLDSLRRYPKGVYFMLGNEFCERFSFYGMRAILMLYLITEHQFSESNASLIFHAFVCVAYLSPLVGSVLADNFFGRFHVILWVSLIYVFGHGLLSMGAVPALDDTIRRGLDFAGLFTIAVATGGIKPCVSAFAADQFPADMKREREQFFSFFYFAINAGSLLAITTTPLLRGRIKCLGSEYCFPLAFGVPGLLMLVALVLFLLGWGSYKRIPVAKGNVVWKVCRCIANGCYRRVRQGKAPNGGHWLDSTSPEFGADFVEGVKSMLSIVTLFLPVVLFWALFDQLGSTWILQARRMNGRVGPLIILPDQMNIFNPAFILILVPIFEGCLYPALRKLKVPLTALKKMAAGGIIAALSFVLAGFLQLKVNSSLVPQPNAGTVTLISMNNADCNLSLTNGGNLTYPISAFDNSHFSHVPIGIWQLDSDTNDCPMNQLTLNVSIDGEGLALAMYQNFDGTVSTTMQKYELEKTENGKTRLYPLISPYLSSANNSLILIYEYQTFPSDSVPAAYYDFNNSQKSFIDLEPALISSDLYDIYLGEHCLDYGPHPTCSNYSLLVNNFVAGMGAAHALVVSDASNASVELLISENTVSLLWQLPQFLMITIGEVLVSVTGLEFSYSQASPNMKSMLQACWLLTVAFGNFIDMAISGSHVVPEPATEFFVYAALMALVVLVFIWLAHNYTYVDPDRWNHKHDIVEKVTEDQITQEINSKEL